MSICSCSLEELGGPVLADKLGPQADKENGGVSGLSLFHDYIKSFLRQLDPRRLLSRSHWLPNTAWKAWRDLVLFKVTQLGKTE